MRNTLRNLPEFLPSRTAPTLHRHAKVHGPAGATALLAAAALLATPGAASAHEAHIHQHGLATLELSQQEGSVIVHFRSPLDSLIGFETEPATPEQHAKAHLLLKQLQDARAILSLPAAAGCMHQAPAITAPTLQDDDDDHGHGKDHDHDHDHDHDKDHGHDHEQGKDQDHGHGGQAHKQGGHDHDHEDDDGHEHKDAQGHQHADLSVRYTFSCKTPAALDSVSLTAFQSWPRLREVDVAVVTDKGQQAARLNARRNTLRW